MASVALEGVSKVYPGGVEALRDLDLEVRDRELLVLLGPSGCGKTTTLRLIAGLEQVTTGEIRVAASTVNHLPPKDRNIAMVFQNYALYPHMSVYKNLAYGLQLREGGGWLRRLGRRLGDPQAAADARRKTHARVRETATLLGLEPLLHRRPWQLSGGERQRVALGRALVRQPAVFLLDEPLSNLDAPLRLVMRRELRDLQRRLQTTMIYVTHDQTEAMSLGDRIAVMRTGTIQQIGAPMEVYERPQNRFVAQAVGSTPMNLVCGRIRAYGAASCFESDSGGLRVAPLAAVKGKDGDRVELGVRPEDVSLTTDARTPAAHQALVSVVEPFGDHTLVGVLINGSHSKQGDTGEQLICRTDPRTNIRAGDRVAVTIDADRVHVFDVRSGSNLTRQDRPSPPPSVGGGR
jgi:multiple sugar transport system ATP-binding protein